MEGFEVEKRKGLCKNENWMIFYLFILFGWSF